MLITDSNFRFQGEDHILLYPDMIDSCLPAKTERVERLMSSPNFAHLSAGPSLHVCFVWAEL